MSAKVQFELPDPTYEEYTWLYEDEHGPASQTPLIATSPTLAGGPAGESRAPPRAIRVNGYTYTSAPRPPTLLERSRRRTLPPP